MLAKLQNAERVCNAIAIISGFLFLAAMSGQKPNGVGAIAMLVLMIVMAVIAGRFRKQINSILVEQQKNLPVNTTRATVLKRRVGYRYRPGGKSSVRSSPPMYYVTFQTEVQGPMEFYVLNDVYFAAQEGRTGYLKYKGNEFISFN